MFFKYLKAFMWLFIILFSGLFLVSLLEYFSLSSEKVTNILKIIVLLASLFISSLMLAGGSDNKGYQKGLFIGIIYNIVCILFSIILGKFVFNSKFFILLFITIICSILGGIIGIGGKKSSN